MTDRRDQASARREALIAASRQAAAPIEAELVRMGIRIESLSDLVNKPLDYRSAIPVLLAWLPRVDNLAVKETIVRGLTVKWARPLAAPALIEEFRKAPDEAEFGLKWAIGNALAVVADDSVFEDIVELLRDRRHHRAREMLALSLVNMRNPRRIDILIELLDDEELVGHALQALRKIAPPEAQSAIEPLVNHPKTWVRNEARRALAKIRRKAERE